MTETPGGAEDGPGPAEVDGRWRRADTDGDLGGSDHGSDVTAWHPVYQHESAVVARLRHVACPEWCQETPALVLRIDNVDQPGEIAMTADDVSAMIEGLLGLRRALLAPDGDGTDR
jgi:hypothetical protein